MSLKLLPSLEHHRFINQIFYLFTSKIFYNIPHPLHQGFFVILSTYYLNNIILISMSRENLNLISLLENTLIFQKSHIKNKSIIKKTVKQNITSLQYIHFNICFSPNLNNKVVCNGTSLLCLHLPHAYTHTLI